MSVTQTQSAQHMGLGSFTHFLGPVFSVLFVFVFSNEL